MKTFKINIFIAIIAALAVTFQSCKAKKMIAKPAPPAEVESKPVVEHKPAPAPPAAKPAPAPQKPDFHFKNIQFDYNSAVLRTSGIQYLDHIVEEMKKDPSARFILNGNASSEGTAEHNMSLSVDRANAVKLYLTNAGVDVSDLSVKGYGSKKPITSNKTEKGRELNRRVEVKLVH
ncbi:MAG TPA: OmpA family protein [Mucilaginibacter sp.]|jgi:OOP family OmpA-OmpF porin